MQPDSKFGIRPTVKYISLHQQHIPYTERTEKRKNRVKNLLGTTMEKLECQFQIHQWRHDAHEILLIRERQQCI
jgi:hypothetical protein